MIYRPKVNTANKALKCKEEITEVRPAFFTVFSIDTDEFKKSVKPLEKVYLLFKKKQTRKRKNAA